MAMELEAAMPATAAYWWTRILNDCDERFRWSVMSVGALETNCPNLLGWQKCREKLELGEGESCSFYTIKAVARLEWLVTVNDELHQRLLTIELIMMIRETGRYIERFLGPRLGVI
jgi:hypothetical protein